MCAKNHNSAGIGITIAAVISAMAVPASGQVFLFSESFEFPDGTFTRSDAGVDNVAGGAYFMRSNSVGGFSGAQGSYYYVGEDLNGMSGHIGFDDGDTTLNTSSKGALSFPQLNIGGFTDLKVSLLVAASFPGGFDASLANGDKLGVQVSVDGGAFAEIGRFAMDTSQPSVTSNTTLVEIVSGTAITTAFSDWTFSIPGTGNTLDLRLVLRSTTPSADELIAFDHVRVTAVPEPSHIALATGLLALVITCHRRRSLKRIGA